jgi:SAM-dependent methyltransferase
MQLENAYEDERRAATYATLEWGGTYHLVLRDLPGILAEHVKGRRALDFGCGSGRSTRLLKGLGFEVVGVDISPEMLAIARERDPQGEYLLLTEGELGSLLPGPRDLILSSFTFDNIPTLERKTAILRELAALLAPHGRLVSLVSSPQIYLHEWASFSTRDFPENRRARSGEVVRIVITDTEDERPVEDVVCSDEDYRRVFAGAGLRVLEVARPLGRAEDPVDWVSETRVAPWVVYVLERDTT